MDDIKPQEPIVMYLGLDHRKPPVDQDERFLRSVEAVRVIAGGDIAYKPKGEYSRVVQFKTFFQFAMFNVHVWEEAGGKIPLEFICEFPHGLNPYWMKSAKAILRTMGVRYELETSNTDATFRFGKFAWKAAFQSAVEDGTIDRMTTALWQADLLMGKERLRNYDKRPVLSVNL